MPVRMWLPGFFFPQGFLTATKQTTARRHQLPIDRLDFSVRILRPSEEEDPPAVKDGLYVYGLTLTGASWDRGTGYC